MGLMGLMGSFTIKQSSEQSYRADAFLLDFGHELGTVFNDVDVSLLFALFAMISAVPSGGQAVERDDMKALAVVDVNSHLNDADTINNEAVIGFLIGSKRIGDPKSGAVDSESGVRGRRGRRGGDDRQRQPHNAVAAINVAQNHLRMLVFRPVIAAVDPEQGIILSNGLFIEVEAGWMHNKSVNHDTVTARC